MGAGIISPDFDESAPVGSSVPEPVGSSVPAPVGSSVPVPVVGSSVPSQSSQSLWTPWIINRNTSISGFTFTTSQNPGKFDTYLSGRGFAPYLVARISGDSGSFSIQTDVQFTNTSISYISAGVGVLDENFNMIQEYGLTKNGASSLIDTYPKSSRGLRLQPGTVDTYKTTVNLSYNGVDYDVSKSPISRTDPVILPISGTWTGPNDGDEIVFTSITPSSIEFQYTYFIAGYEDRRFTQRYVATYNNGSWSQGISFTTPTSLRFYGKVFTTPMPSSSPPRPRYVVLFMKGTGEGIVSPPIITFLNTLQYGLETWSPSTSPKSYLTPGTAFFLNSQTIEDGDGVPNAEACMSVCDNNTQCKAIEFDNASKNCKLKDYSYVSTTYGTTSQRSPSVIVSTYIKIPEVHVKYTFNVPSNSIVYNKDTGTRIKSLVLDSGFGTVHCVCTLDTGIEKMIMTCEIYGIKQSDYIPLKEITFVQNSVTKDISISDVLIDQVAGSPGSPGSSSWNSILDESKLILEYTDREQQMYNISQSQSNYQTNPNKQVSKLILVCLGQKFDCRLGKNVFKRPSPSMFVIKFGMGSDSLYIIPNNEDFSDVVFFTSSGTRLNSSMVSVMTSSIPSRGTQITGGPWRKVDVLNKIYKMYAPTASSTPINLMFSGVTVPEYSGCKVRIGGDMYMFTEDNTIFSFTTRESYYDLSTATNPEQIPLEYYVPMPTNTNLDIDGTDFLKALQSVPDKTRRLITFPFEINFILESGITFSFTQNEITFILPNGTRKSYRVYVYSNVVLFKGYCGEINVFYSTEDLPNKLKRFTYAGNGLLLGGTSEFNYSPVSGGTIPRLTEKNLYKKYNNVDMNQGMDGPTFNTYIEAQAHCNANENTVGYIFVNGVYRVKLAPLVQLYAWSGTKSFIKRTFVNFPESPSTQFSIVKVNGTRAGEYVQSMNADQNESTPIVLWSRPDQYNNENVDVDWNTHAKFTYESDGTIKIVKQCTSFPRYFNVNRGDCSGSSDNSRLILWRTGNYFTFDSDTLQIIPTSTCSDKALAITSGLGDVNIIRYMNRSPIVEATMFSIFPHSTGAGPPNCPPGSVFRGTGAQCTIDDDCDPDPICGNEDSECRNNRCACVPADVPLG